MSFLDKLIGHGKLAGMKIGKCENCGFMGLLMRKAIAPTDSLDVITGEGTGTPVPILNVCLECAHTPYGCRSLNVEHERLPEREYLA